jgi:hypothetical protein
MDIGANRLNTQTLFISRLGTLIKIIILRREGGTGVGHGPPQIRKKNYK